MITLSVRPETSMVDRAAIFADVTRRDALRREARLAPLNVPAEHHRAVALAIEAELRALADDHQDVLRIRDEVTTEFLPHFGPVQEHSWGGRYAIGHETARRSYEFLRGVHGIEAARARHPVG